MDAVWFVNVTKRFPGCNLSTAVKRANQETGCNYTTDDYWDMKQIIRTDKTDTLSRENAYIFNTSDMHYNALYKNERGEIYYDHTVLEKAVQHKWRAVKKLYEEWGWDKRVGIFYWIDHGDMFEGYGQIYETQAFDLDPFFINMEHAKSTIIKNVFLPILAEARELFGEVRIVLNPGNHDKLAYKANSHEYMTYGIAEMLKLLGFTVYTDSIAPSYILTDVVGWGFLTSHGNIGTLKNISPGRRLEGEIATLARNLPGWHYYGRGHYHRSTPLTLVAGHPRTRDVLEYYELSSPVQGSIHQENFKPKGYNWIDFVVNPKKGVIQNFPFDMTDIDEDLEVSHLA